MKANVPSRGFAMGTDAVLCGEICTRAVTQLAMPECYALSGKFRLCERE